MMKKILLIALLMVGTTGLNLAQQVKDVQIPGDAWTAYNIPEGGSALKLNINRANTNLVIDDSTIQFEYDDAVDWWYDSGASSAAKHVYQIGTVLSSREYVRIFGHYHYLGGGGGAPPTFYARVAAPDVDMESLTEEQEESLGVWIGKGGTRKAVTVNPVQCRMGSIQQTLTWSSSKLSLWTAATGGSILPGSSKSLSADQSYTYYAQGDNSSGSIRDAEIKAAYTVSGQTAYDKVKLTVVGAEIGAFDTILLNATNDVSVTLLPNPPGTNITLQISCLGGSGSAVFVPSGSTTSNLTQSATVKIKGVTASSTVSNMILRAMFGSDVLASNVFSVGPVVEMKSIEFTSDHGLLKDNTNDWTDSGTTYGEPEWVNGTATNNPMSHTKDTKLTVKVKIKVEPVGITFDLEGDGPNDYVDFSKTNNTSTGADQEITITADTNLPNQVCTLTKSIDWKIKVNGTECGAGSSGAHRIYVTYGTPTGSEVTEMRLSWDCETCDGQTNLQGIADTLYTAFESEPPVFSLTNANITSPPYWLLMASTTNRGQCIALAGLMEEAVELLGGSASIGYVYGSSDTNCYSTSSSAHESRTCTNTNHPGTERIHVWSAGGWNNWEAVCKVEDTCYAVKLDKGSPIEILRNWLGSNSTNGNHQAWQYHDGIWHTCTNPGPYPIPKP